SDRSPTSRGVAAEGADHAVLEDELADLLGVDLDVGLGVDDDRLDLHAGDTAIGVDLVDGVEDDLRRIGLDHRQGAGQREQHADLDRSARLDPGGRRRVAREDVRETSGDRGARGGPLQNAPPADTHLRPSFWHMVVWSYCLWRLICAIGYMQCGIYDAIWQ